MVRTHGPVSSLPSCGRASNLLLAALGAVVFSPIVGAQHDQFLDPPHLPVEQVYSFDSIQGEWVNFETQLIEPMVFFENAAQEGILAVCNVSDDRVVFLDDQLEELADLVVGQGPRSLAFNPATDEVWVSVAQQACVVVLDVSDADAIEIVDLLRPSIDAAGVGAGAAASPGGIAFAGDYAYVVARETDSLSVYHAQTRAYEDQLALEIDWLGSPMAMNDPFNILAYDGRLYVTSHLSGNNTASRQWNGVDLDDQSQADARELLGPDDVRVVRLPDLDLSLPDFDIAVVDPTGGAGGYGAVTRMISGVGTVLFGIGAITNNVYENHLVVSNLEARNADRVGETGFEDGRVSENRLTYIDLDDVGDPSLPLGISTILTESLGGVQLNHVVMPTDIEVVSGYVFVAGYCSSNIGVWQPNGNFLGLIPAEPGTRGLAVDRPGGTLYALNFADESVTAYDLTTLPTLPTSPSDSYDLVTPTYDRVKAGRVEFLRPNSGLQTANCATCHVDGRRDGLGWNLSKILDEANAGTDFNPDFRDRKGVMVTQTLRGLVALAPYHWRGEQRDIESFSGAFAELLHGTEPLEKEMDLIRDYIFSLEFPANPFQMMNRNFSEDALDGGLGSFAPPTPGSLVTPRCDQCHALPLAANGDISTELVGNSTGEEGSHEDGVSPLVMEVASLRGLWPRLSHRAELRDENTGLGADEVMPVSGFGLLHEGMIDDVDRFMQHLTGLGPGGVEEDRAKLAEFIAELDSGVAPAANYAEYVDGPVSNETNDRLTYLVDAADQGECDVAVRGKYDDGTTEWLDVGLVYDPGAGNFVSGEPGFPGPHTLQDLIDFADDDEVRLLFMGVPVWSGERIGIDRDRDGISDGSEADLGYDPADPDTDEDGYWDSNDPDPLVPDAFVAGAAPGVVSGSVEVLYTTTNAIKLVYETDGFTPSLVLFGTDPAALDHVAGDDPVTEADFETWRYGNVWKRRHTVFLRPQLDEDPPLEALVPNTEYSFVIRTIGQNEQTADSAVMTTPRTLSNVPATATFRTRSIDFGPTRQNPNGSLTYVVTADFELTQTSDPPKASDDDALEGALVPARFTIYDNDGEDPNGDYEFTDMYSTVVAIGSWPTATYRATFVHTTLPNYQSTGDLTTFDIPMFVAFDLVPPGEPDRVSYPEAGGQWSDGPSHVRTTAP